MSFYVDSEARSEVMARVWSINFIFKTGWTRGRKHCWKVKCLRRVNETRSAFDYEIGVTCTKYVDELPFADAVTKAARGDVRGRKSQDIRR